MTADLKQMIDDTDADPRTVRIACALAATSTVAALNYLAYADLRHQIEAGAAPHLAAASAIAKRPVADHATATLAVAA